MKKKICLLVMISLIISNIYCGEEDAVESLIEAIETERKLVLQENDYEIIGEEEGGERGIYIKILNKDITERIDSKMIEPGIIYINGEARFARQIIRGSDSREPDPESIWSPSYVWIDSIGMEHVVILQENDYGIFSSYDDYLTIVILNENKMKRIKEADTPAFIIYIDGSVKFVKGMGILESSRPYFPCDYIFLWTGRDRKAIFDYGILLLLQHRDFVERARQAPIRQLFWLMETDYEIIRKRNGRLTIKILNKDKLREIREPVSPEIYFRMNNNREMIAQGIKTSGLEVPYPCDYTFEIDSDNKVIFSNRKRDSLILTPIEEHIIKYIENLNIQYILNNSYEEQYNIDFRDTLSPTLNGMFKGISALKDKEQLNGKEHINISNIILIILLVAIGGFITYWIAFRRKA